MKKDIALVVVVCIATLVSHALFTARGLWFGNVVLIDLNVVLVLGCLVYPLFSRHSKERS
jgi:hypothetical protein